MIESLKKPINLPLFLLLIVTGIIYLFRLNFPNEVYFDEAYHLPAARLSLNNDSRFYEWWHEELNIKKAYPDWLHPPLAKYLQAISAIVFQQKIWAFRLPSALAGIISIYFVYQLSLKILKNNQSAFFSAFIFASSGLVFVMSRITMNDMLMTCFSLASVNNFFAYLEKYDKMALFKASLWLGLALATKWSVIFIWLTILAIFIFQNYHKFSLKKFYQLCVLILNPISIYFLSFAQMFAQGKTVNYFFKLHQQILRFQFSNASTHRYASTPLEWVFNLRPIWLFQEKLIDQTKLANIYLIEHPVFVILALGSLVYFGIYIYKNRSQIGTKKLLLLLVFYLASFLPWLFSPRIMFYYHYLPAIPFLAIMMSFTLHKLVKQKIWQNIVIISLIVSFFLFYPHYTALAVNKSFAKSVYFLLPSWK